MIRECRKQPCAIDQSNVPPAPPDGRVRQPTNTKHHRWTITTQHRQSIRQSMRAKSLPAHREDARHWSPQPPPSLAVRHANRCRRICRFRIREREKLIGDRSIDRLTCNLHRKTINIKASKHDRKIVLRITRGQSSTNRMCCQQTQMRAVNKSTPNNATMNQSRVKKRSNTMEIERNGTTWRASIAARAAVADVNDDVVIAVR